MCESCVEHGEGKAWYLEAGNHSRDLRDRLDTELLMRRQATRFERSSIRLFTLYDRLSPVWKRIPAARRLAHAWAERRQRKKHIGQVVPPQHLAEVFRLAGSIVRLPCTCRRFVKGKPEARYCLGLGFDPWRVYDGMPGYRGGFETLTPEQAIEMTASFRREEPVIHTVWTMPTPYVASLCNCTMAECGAMLTAYKLGIKVIMPGELRVTMDRERCSGCRRCLGECPFDLFTMDGRGRVAVASERCQGCGRCVEFCLAGALALEERTPTGPLLGASSGEHAHQPADATDGASA